METSSYMKLDGWHVECLFETYPFPWQGYLNALRMLAYFYAKARGRVNYYM